MTSVTRVLISLPDDFLEKVDLAAALEQRSRSELIREALRLYFNTNLPQLNVLDKRKAKKKEKEEASKAKSAKQAAPKAKKPVAKAKAPTKKGKKVAATVR